MKLIKPVIIFFFLWGSAFAQERKLIWADEFKYKGLPDATKWSYDTGGHGWGNNELQYYTHAEKKNAIVKNGKLVLKAKKETKGNNQFTSARLVSKNKGDWKYGRVEVRAKLPDGRGIWPAIWMLPTHWRYGGWPKSGEIDIMEFVGYNPDTVFASVHTESFNHAIGTQKTAGIYQNDVSKKFHVYAIDWTPETIKFYIDDVQYHEFRNEKTGSAAWPFDEEFHIILNIAVGGNWGGKHGVDEKVFPQKMEVDYVRVYQ